MVTISERKDAGAAIQSRTRVRWQRFLQTHPVIHKQDLAGVERSAFLDRRQLLNFFLGDIKPEHRVHRHIYPFDLFKASDQEEDISGQLDFTSSSCEPVKARPVLPTEVQSVPHGVCKTCL